MRKKTKVIPKGIVKVNGIWRAKGTDEDHPTLYDMGLSVLSYHYETSRSFGSRPIFVDTDRVDEIIRELEQRDDCRWVSDATEEYVYEDGEADLILYRNVEVISEHYCYYSWPMDAAIIREHDLIRESGILNK